MGFLSAVTGIAGAIIGGKAASKAAARKQEAAMDVARQTQARFEESKAALTPWRQAGLSALEQYQRYMGPGGQKALAREIQTTPGYQFRMGEGQQALLRAASARGGLGGGALSKDITRFAQGLASQEAGGYLNRLAQLSQTGLGTTRDITSLGAAATGDYGKALQQSADARASGYLARAGALSSGLSSFAGGVESAMLGGFGGFGGGGQSTTSFSPIGVGGPRSGYQRSWV